MPKRDLRAQYGSWALVTGAARSVGLGYAFAHELATAGINLVLVDILADELEARAAELRAQYGVEVRAAGIDLGALDFIDRLDEYTGDIEIGLLVCNHMYTPQDTPRMLDMDLDVHHRMMDINARAYTTLIHTYGREMRDRGRGGIIIVSSGAGLVPAPFTSSYSANKAYQIALGETLWYELKGTGVDVLVLAAGMMRTHAEGTTDYPDYIFVETDASAREALMKLGKQHLVFPGWATKVFMFLQTRLMSRQRAINSIGAFMTKGLGKSR